MNYEDLTQEQQEKLLACKTANELISLAEEEGVELSDDELQEIAGGGWSPKDALPKCPVCGSYAILINPMPGTGCAICTCHDCGHQWTKTVLDPILPTP